MATEQERGVVKYQARNGQEVTLTFEAIKKFLVRGKRELVTTQEMVFFIGICKAKGLDPFAQDCYLVKYTKDDPAAIITSIDYFKARAKAQSDCKGWKAGDIVIDKEGKVKRTSGLVMDDEKLIGGWFTAQPDGWNEIFELEVNLKGYIKRKSDGNVTKFWAPEKQPTMIRKVALSQGLRELWPDEFQGIYSEEEISPPAEEDVFDMTEGVDYEIPKEKIDEFDNTLYAREKSRDTLDDYILKCAEHFELSVNEFKGKVIDDGELEKFWTAYLSWKENTKQEKKEPDETPEERPKDPELDKLRNNPQFAKLDDADLKIIAEFWWLKEKGLIQWEKENRKDLPNMAPAVKKAFDAKWQKVFNEPYIAFIKSLREDPGAKKDPKEDNQKATEQAHMDAILKSITCPYGDKIQSINECKDCKDQEKCQPYAEYQHANKE